MHTWVTVQISINDIEVETSKGLISHSPLPHQTSQLSWQLGVTLQTGRHPASMLELNLSLWFDVQCLSSTGLDIYVCIRYYRWYLIRRCGIWTPSLTFSEVSWSPLSRVISSGTQNYTLKDALKVSPQKINTDICFVVFCWLQNIWFGLFQAAQHRQIQLHHSTTAAFLFTALD